MNPVYFVYFGILMGRSWLFFLCLTSIIWPNANSLATNDSTIHKTKRNLVDTSTNYGDRPPLYYATRPVDYFTSFKQPFVVPNAPPEYYKKPEMINPQIVYPHQPPVNQPPPNLIHQQQQVAQTPLSSPQNPQYSGPQQFTEQSHPENLQDFNRGVYTTAETVVSPVQHSSLVHHGQNYAQVQFQPYPGPPHYHQPLVVPKRVLYQAPVRYNVVPHHQHIIHQNPTVYHQHPITYHHPKPVVNYIPHNLGNNGFPDSLHHFVPTQPVKKFKQPNLQPITKPSHAPKVHEENEEESDEKNEKLEDEEGDDEKSNYSEEGDHYERYSNDDDDESSRERYQDDNEDDTERDDSKVVKFKYSPSKYNEHGQKKYNDYYSDGYSYSYNSKDKHKSKSPKQKSEKKKKYAEKHNKKKSSPKNSKLQARDTENVPVIQKNYFSEKWFVTKTKNNERKT